MWINHSWKHGAEKCSGYPRDRDGRSFIEERQLKRKRSGYTEGNMSVLKTSRSWHEQYMGHWMWWIKNYPVGTKIHFLKKWNLLNSSWSHMHMLHSFRQSPKIVEARWVVKAWVQVLVWKHFPWHGRNFYLRIRHGRVRVAETMPGGPRSVSCAQPVLAAPEDPAAPVSPPYWASGMRRQGLCFVMCQEWGHREEEKEGREN